MNSDEIKDKLFLCLNEQLNEIELLCSMYSKEELIFTDSKTLQDVRDFIENKTQYTPGHIDFTLYLILDGKKLEISINLPTFYPDEEPDVYIRCNQMNRYQESSLNKSIMNFVKLNLEKEPCVYSIITWVQENFEEYSKKEESIVERKPKDLKAQNVKFARFWIFSHHIYNKKKREEIVKIAQDLNLTGFSLIGKPGIICVEGYENDCQEWWKVIKSMNWKKIVLRKIELFEVQDQQKQQRFFKFEEIAFQNVSSRNSKHADMSEFSKYIEEKNLSDAFNDFFGFSNNS